jgi:hypothetical protein
MSERWEPTHGHTLPWDIQLLSLVDDQEGFRVLLQDTSQFVYGVYADAVFYRRCVDLSFANFNDSPPQMGKNTALVYRVHNSNLIEWLMASDLGALVKDPLAHFALCFKHDERIDIVCRGEVNIRAAHSRHDHLSEKA